MSNRQSRTVVLGAIVALVFIAAGLVCALSFGAELDDRTTPIVLQLMGLIGLAVTSLLALVRADEAARQATQASSDIRNGVLQEKAKQGAVEAIRTEQVVTREGPVVTAQLDTLGRILESHAVQSAALLRHLERTEGVAIGDDDRPTTTPA